MVALLTIPAAALLGIDLSSDPQQLAFLYGVTLLGTWTTLVPNKLIEARKPDGINRRLIALAAGLLVGGVALVLARALRLDLIPQQEFFDNPRYLSLRSIFRRSLYHHGRMVIARCSGDRTGGGSASCPYWPRRPWQPRSSRSGSYTRQDGIAIAVLIATTV